MPTNSQPVHGKVDRLPGFIFLQSELIFYLELSVVVKSGVESSGRHLCFLSILTQLTTDME